MSVYIRVMQDEDKKEYLLSSGNVKDDTISEEIIDFFNSLSNNSQATRYMIVRSSDDVVVGSFELSFCCDVACEISDILIYEKYRRCGYALSALYQIEELVVLKRIEYPYYLYLRVEQDNIPALNLYNKAGFEIYRVGEVSNRTYMMQKCIS